MADLYAVVGNPIKHSKSPAIHGQFAQQTQEAVDYTKLLAPLDNFSGFVRDFFAQGGKGLNVTVPFKEQAWELSQRLSPAAQLAGAVNTLYLNDAGELCGDNTDGVGMVRDIIVNQGCEIAGKRVLILGAGGAVRGVLQPVIAQAPAAITIANRTASKAEALADLVHELMPVSACGYPDLEGQTFDVVINGTSASLGGSLPSLPANLLAPNAWVYDMMYGAEPTIFMAWAADHGADKTIDGLGMLVEQAAESFNIWRGVRPDSAPVLASLRQELTV
ncbi:MAG: shikimate dehydrogenase [Pontibacterium sp.]